MRELLLLGSIWQLLFEELLTIRITFSFHPKWFRSICGAHSKCIVSKCNHKESSLLLSLEYYASFLNVSLYLITI